jgi:hypothetical protein
VLGKRREVSGQRREGHSRALNALPHILGAQRQGDADYLDGCRQKRNAVEYDYAGGATKQDAEELIAYGHELRAEVLAWVREKHSGLAPKCPQLPWCNGR